MKTEKQKKKNVRLAPHTTGVHYEVLLKPDLEAHVFAGEETITLSVGKSTQDITLHAKDLEILSATLILGKIKHVSKKIVYNEKMETATFVFAKKIPKGTAKLHLVFRGVLADTMRGFYKSKYVVDGKDRWMATTQFEATDARRCIPCFDEPVHKATFDIHLVVADGKTAISNTLPVSIREHEAGYKVVSFARTPKMSTYLLAFLIGDFEWVEKKTKRGVLVRVMTVPGKKHQAHFALDVAVRSLEFYEKYFDIPYPLNTLDMIAVPDFASGAMENWGAVTYREVALLIDEHNSSIASRERVAEVIAHELAHQWFGNLVTMEWWTHLWLNEGFASYIPYLALDSLFPEWHIWDDFPISTLAAAMQLDALATTHPIEVEVHHPNEIGEIFDAVSYSKGATVIRMLAEYLGEKDFRDGLRLYLKKHSYKNASTIHLWEAFEKVSKKPVRKMMAVWTGTSGYPLVSVTRKDNSVTLSQTRFFSSSVSKKKSKDTTLWPIPLLVVTAKGEQSLGLMTKKTEKFTLPVSGWCKLNAKEGSLYRTSYDTEMLEALAKPIQEGRISAADRLGIIRDLFILSEAGVVETTHALDMLTVYRGETEYIVWAEIISGLRYLANLLYSTPMYERFCAFSAEFLGDIITRVGWEKRTNEFHSDVFLRSIALSAGVAFGHAPTIQEAKRRFTIRKTESISADLRLVVYGAIARTGGEKEYKQLLALYRAETLHEEKNRILAGLCRFSDKKLIAQTLELAINGEVRLQDQIRVFAGIFANPAAREQGWKFMKKHWKKLSTAYGTGNHLLSHIVSSLNHFTTKEMYTDIQIFFKKNPAPGAERTVQQTLEHIDSNVRWLARDGKKIEKWLKEKQS